LIVILGPTASGKSSLAIKLAKKFSGEIIAADSRTIYQFLDIGTAKPTKQEQEIVPHYLLDIIKPDQEFSVAKFQILARQKIAEISQRGKLPFLVGGTGLYLEAVCQGFKIPRPKPDLKLRIKLAKKSLPELLTELKKTDPASFKKIDHHNKRRIIRALEVYLSSGKRLSDLQARSQPNLKILKIGLAIPRPKLYRRINQRVNQMIKDGLAWEVKKLYRLGYDYNLPALSGLAYRQIGEYVRGKMTLRQAIEETKQKTRNYAKRQITWFSRDKNINWVTNQKQAEKLINKFLKNNK